MRPILIRPPPSVAWMPTIVEPEAYVLVPAPARREPAILNIISVRLGESSGTHEPWRARDTLEGDAILLRSFPLLLGIGVHRCARAGAAARFLAVYAYHVEVTLVIDRRADGRGVRVAPRNPQVP